MIEAVGLGDNNQNDEFCYIKQNQEIILASKLCGIHAVMFDKLYNKADNIWNST